MGRGDKRSKRGKIFKGSYGKTRSHSVKKAGPSAPKAVASKAVAPKKAPAAKKTK
jgi:30S ribosomal protein S31